MALVQATLSTALYNAFISAANAAALNNPDGNAILQTECDSIAAAIDSFVKSGTVTVPALGLISASPGSPVTGTAIGTIS